MNRTILNDLNDHIAQMAPHQKEREGGRLLLESREAIRELYTALEESTRLQSHYAKLLNMYDGGERMQFGANGWIDRLKETGTLPADKEPE